MSYSYIKSVFPNYSSDPHIPTDPYCMTLQPASSEPTPPAPAPAAAAAAAPTPALDTLTPVADDKNNLKFYMPPLPKINVEKFEEPQANHDAHMAHVLGCKTCREKLRAKLGMSTSPHEEIIEIISYILFGIFFLMLIDRMKRI